MSARPSFFAELRRRNVYKVAVGYAVVGWLVMQVAATVVPALHLPEGLTTAVVVVVLLGFPIALVIAWAFEMTPAGMKRTENISPNEAIPQWSRRKFAVFVVAVAMLAAGLLAYQFIRPKAKPSPAGKIMSGGAATSPAIPDKSIAVLPFDNLSRDPDNAFFAEGVQDEILTRLAKVADLKVISRTSTQHFKSSPENLPEIAQRLGVRNILEGSVQKSNDQVRVNVQLINATNDAHLWADIYDRKLTDLFAVESDIAKTIADTLQAKLTGSEKTAIAARPTENPEAYQLYLKGRFFWNKRTASDLRKSIDYFHQAIENDPGYALAYAGLAQSWLLLPAYGGGAPHDSFPQAAAAANKALALDDTSSDARTALIEVKASYDFDYAGATREFKRAILLNPNDATAHHWFADSTLEPTGQGDHAIAEMKRALELDPLSLIINTNLGAACMYAGHLDEAVTQLRKAVEMDGSFPFARWNLAQALQLQGNIPAAIAEYQKAIALSNDPLALGLLGQLFGTLGRKDEARALLDRLRRRRDELYTPAYCLAVVHLGLGERAEALDLLEQAYRDRDGYTIGIIRIDPALVVLRGDPRFEALAEKVVPAREFAKSATSSK